MNDDGGVDGRMGRLHRFFPMMLSVRSLFFNLAHLWNIVVPKYVICNQMRRRRKRGEIYYNIFWFIENFHSLFFFIKIVT
jgi:hypothetical protein